MSLPDLVNGVYECLGGFVILLSIRKLHRHKQVKGVHWAQVVFFTSWGFWNLFYYPHLGQLISAAGAGFLAVANAIWASQIVYYVVRNKSSRVSA